ncbi:hypothetical protein NCCP1664_25830 [Zafaria cholistanensis]|uniref:Uncharacterized protein n=1 Tax=Zafaria cholistanensis TaxID=1682741 RepID=A0A5A7NVF9_9MICC|nr:hypothetical protein NCCP1664_25830 [Zafaria cholistanensis]
MGKDLHSVQDLGGEVAKQFQAAVFRREQAEFHVVYHRGFKGGSGREQVYACCPRPPTTIRVPGAGSDERRTAAGVGVLARRAGLVPKLLIIKLLVLKLMVPNRERLSAAGRS